MVMRTQENHNQTVISLINYFLGLATYSWLISKDYLCIRRDKKRLHQYVIFLLSSFAPYYGRFHKYNIAKKEKRNLLHILFADLVGVVSFCNQHMGLRSFQQISTITKEAETDLLLQEKST
jgi:uncharacterized membrane protein